MPLSKVMTFAGFPLMKVPHGNVRDAELLILDKFPKRGDANVRGVKLFDPTTGKVLEDQDDLPEEVLCGFILYENWLDEAFHKYPGWEWDMFGLSRHPNVTMKFVEEHLDLEWKMLGLSQNPNLTIEFVEEHIYWEWDMFWLSRNSNLTMEFVEAHLDWEWEMVWLSKHPNLTKEFVEAHMDLEWDFLNNYFNN